MTVDPPPARGNESTPGPLNGLSRSQTQQDEDVQEVSQSLADLSLINRRLRILCLHGYGGSGSTFRTKIAHLLPILSYYGDCVFVDGPSVKDGGRAWWHAKDNGGTVNYEGWDTARSAFIRIFDEQGPFDGVLGFSQGAILTSVLSGLRHPAGQPPTPEYPFTFSFAIMISGFQARDASFSKLYDKRELYKLPSLHVVGTADEVVPEEDSLKLARRFDGSRIIKHGGGHIVPNFWKFKETLGYFVKEQYERKGTWLDHQARPNASLGSRGIENGGGLSVPSGAERRRPHESSPGPAVGPHPHEYEHDNGHAARHSGNLVIPLWSTPNSPTMRVVFPKGHHAHASPILAVFRGGAYATARGSGEGTVEWAAARGFLAVEVDYGTASTKRYYPDNYCDGARAIRLIRSRAKVWNANPDKLALLGYSAGGHLAALLGTRPKMHRNYDDDLFDKFSARPNLLILAYGVLSFVDGYSPSAFSSSVNNFFGSNGAKTLERQQYSPEYLVDHKTPPTFVWTVEPDIVVPPNHSKLFADAMKKQGRDVEYKLYKTGYHAIGLAHGAGGDVEEWPSTMLQWIEGHWGKKHLFRDLFHKH